MTSSSFSSSDFYSFLLNSTITRSVYFLLVFWPFVLFSSYSPNIAIGVYRPLIDFSRFYTYSKSWLIEYCSDNALALSTSFARVNVWIRSDWTFFYRFIFFAISSALFRASFSEFYRVRRGTIAFGIFVGEFDCFFRGLKFVAQFFKAFLSYSTTIL